MNSIERQREIDAFVDREICYCVSHLIRELAQKEEYFDELYPALAQDDWEEPATDHGFYKNDEGDIVHEDEKESSYESWQEACESKCIDPYTNEAYEHWIVSNWLAEKLEEKGEMILCDFMGLTIWGRTTTGQAISLDYVIGQIYDEIMEVAV